MATIEWPVPPPTAAELAAIAAAKAEAARLHAEADARHAAEMRARFEVLLPLMDALQAAGIKLNVSSYEGVWGTYQIGGGPEVEFDDDGLYTKDYE
jgi:hypothetical protein